MKVQIELTNHCNLKCDDCLRKKMTREKGFMTTRTLLKALTFCMDNEVKEIILHHLGEPLLHKDLLFFIEIAKLAGLKVGFTTNGTLLTYEKIVKFRKAGLDKLNISYNKSSGSEHRKNMLKYFYRISKSFEIETYFRTTIFSKEEYKELKFELKGFDTVFQRGMYFDYNKRRSKNCKAIENVFVIQWDGKVIPCCAIYDDKQYSYGKLGKLTVDGLKLEINNLKMMIENSDKHLENCCNHCFEVEDQLPLDFKL